MTFFTLRFRTFVHATESREKVERAFKFACSQSAEITAEETEGFHGNPILILEATVTGKKNINAAFSHLMSNMPDLSASGCRELLKRLDDDCILHLRLDKQAAYDNRLELATGEDIIDLQAKVKSYPANRKNAAVNLEKYVSLL